MNQVHLRNVFFLLFAVSGFTGLIYESIWSHYLKLFLGHAAYAQALVLSIFMGGMAIGAWFASKWSHYWKNLLVIYAIVEGLIGLFGVCFHPVFKFILDLSYNNIIPALVEPEIVQVYKWSLATILILPQSILLGMTFPLMSNGILRSFPMTPGGSLSLLYFTNSIGAAIGVLVSGFILIAAVGLPGTILFAGLVNILLAIIVYGLAKDQVATTIPQTNTSGSIVPGLLIMAAFITGMASFIYEIVWIRMLSMVLSSSTHSFELMLSAFITGLAFGGLWIRRRIDKLQDPLKFSGFIQIIMGFLALATIFIYNSTFDLMGFFMSAVSRTDIGYYLFNFFSHSIALIVMLPATFCAGMTLPLFTFILLKHGHGEKSIGQIYASNTIGAIIGVSFAIFIGLPILGLKGTMVFGCGLDISLGILLIAQSRSVRNNFIFRVGLVSIIALGLSAFFMNLDVRRMSSGVYRYGIPLRGHEEKIIFNKDGKTATIHVVARPGGDTLILTNGKPDASINMNDDEVMAQDEPTMVLAASIPIAINPDLKQVANIGLGSGLTTHTLLAWPGIEKVDTIEIEPAIVEGAKAFGHRVNRVYTDPRSEIHIEDAKTFFSLHNKKYDLIISEPSNPWVSGTSSLFTDEFYHYISNFLSEDGMLVQWIQTYEISYKLLFTVIKALTNNFPFISLYAPNDYEIFLIAKNNSPVNEPDSIIFESEYLSKDLEMVGVKSIADINLKYIANSKILGYLVDLFKPVSNSDYFPILDLNAPKSRFIQVGTDILNKLNIFPIPIIYMLSDVHVNHYSADISKGFLSTPNALAYVAKMLYQQIISNDINVYENEIYLKTDLLIKHTENCVPEINRDLWLNALIELGGNTLPFLNENELIIMWNTIEKKCNSKLENELANWLNLMKALSLREFHAILDYSYQLYSSTDNNIYHDQFLFMSLLSAYILTGDYHSALELWNNDIHKLYKNSIPLQLKILYIIALQNSY